MRTVLATIGVILVGGLIIVGGYQLGWWLKEDAVNRTAEIQRDSFNFQQTSRNEVVRQYETLLEIDFQITVTEDEDAVAALRAQREAARTQLCRVASQISGDVTPDIDRTIVKECNSR